jgi:hypothetical protein
MTTPVKPVPRVVARWMARVRWFRWHDAFVAWAGLWGASARSWGGDWQGAAAVLPLIVVVPASWFVRFGGTTSYKVGIFSQCPILLVK